jgi:hypothetical protein
MQKATMWLVCGFAAAVQASAVEPISLTGQLAGRVTDASGVPQMGAAVAIFDRYEGLVAKALTTERGDFEFSLLPAGLYSVQVSLPSLVAAARRSIAVQAGMRSFLAVNLSNLIGNIELVYLGPGDRRWMSEEWKWVLRGSGATRPGLRLLPGMPGAQQPHVRSAMFADTRGVVRVSAGEGASTTAYGNQADLGTAFAVATSLFGGHRLEVSGNLGYGSSAGVPTAGFRTSFSPAGQSDARLGLTMRQVYLAGRAGAGLATGGAGAPVLRTYELSMSDKRRLAPDLLIEYGSTLESVVFIERLNYFSPYGRISWGSEETGLVKAGYSSGAPPVALMSSNNGSSPQTELPGLQRDGLQDGLSALSMLPRVSLASGSAHVQRNENLEFGYARAIEKTRLAASIYQERLRNAAGMISGADGLVAASDLLPDLGSRSSVFNYGDFTRHGATVTITQAIGKMMEATIGYALTGALAAPETTVDPHNAADIRAALSRRTMRRGLLARVGGRLPATGTAYSASYQWTDYSVFQPVHYSIVQAAQFDPGLNVSLRQPLPRVSGVLPGRIEATADLRNMLAQGYVPLDSIGGRRMMLIHSPRALRGGLSFIF